jgi:hypothetical protein
MKTHMIQRREGQLMQMQLMNRSYLLSGKTILNNDSFSEKVKVYYNLMELNQKKGNEAAYNILLAIDFISADFWSLGFEINDDVWAIAYISLE